MGSCASLAVPVDRGGVAPVSIVVSSADATPHPRSDVQTQTPCCPAYDFHPALLYNAALLYPRRYVAAAVRVTPARDFDDRSPPHYDPGRRVMSPSPRRVLGRGSLEQLSKTAESPWMLGSAEASLE